MTDPRPAVPAAPAAPPARRPRAVLAMHRDLTGRLFDTDTLARLADLAELDPALVLDDFGTEEARAASPGPRSSSPAGAARRSTGPCSPPPPAARRHPRGGVRQAPHHRRLLGARPAGHLRRLGQRPARRRVHRRRRPARQQAAPADPRGLPRPPRRPARLAARLPRRGQLPAHRRHRRRLRIGRRVLELLRPHDLDLLLHDPYVDEAEAAGLGARLVGLDELCAASDTVSVHAPSSRRPTT